MGALWHLVGARHELVQSKVRQGSTRTMLKIMFIYPTKKAGRCCILWPLGVPEIFLAFVSVSNFLAHQGMKY